MSIVRASILVIFACVAGLAWPRLASAQAAEPSATTGSTPAPSPQPSPPATAPNPTAPNPTAPNLVTPSFSAPAASETRAAPPPAASTPAPLAVPSLGSPAIIIGSGPGKRYTTWDANIEGAYGRIFSDPGQTTGFGRLRAGVLWVRDPTFFALGLTYDISDKSAATLGIQGEWLNLELGVWAQAAPLVDVAHGARLGAMAAVGWSVLGGELQVRDFEGVGVVPAAYVKLRIPIGIIAFGLRGR